jgi:hypothetical protein
VLASAGHARLASWPMVAALARKPLAKIPQLLRP